jgi:hypothetical protein
MHISSFDVNNPEYIDQEEYKKFNELDQSLINPSANNS